MHPPLFDYFRHPELPVPVVDAEEARRLLRERWGIDAVVESLGSQQDQNLLLRHETGGTPFGVLKISNPAFTEAELELQDLAAARVAERRPELRIPRIVDGVNGPARGWWDTSAGRLFARVIAFVPGSTLTGSGYLAPRVVARMGELAAAVSLALADLEHPASARVHQWDLQHAARVLQVIAPTEPDRAVRDEVMALARDAGAALAAVADRLPRQLGHFDLTDDNVLRRAEPGALPDAVIDFGDVTASWAVGELATTLSSLLHHDGMSVAGVLPAIRAFHAARPLTSDEVDALWPLVVLRGAVLVLSGRQQVRIDDENDYASGALDREFRILRQAASAPLAVVTRLIRRDLGMPVDAPPRWSGAPALDVSALDAGPVHVLDAGTTAELNDEGAWLRPGTLDAEAARLLDAGAGAVVLPAGRAVLTGAPARTPEAPATIPTAATLWLARPIARPVGGSVAGPVVLEVTAPGLAPDAPVLPARTPIRVRLRRAGDTTPIPDAVTAAMAPGWAALVGDPAPALGLPARGDGPGDETADGLLTRRGAVLAEVQEHYYARPPEIERGWRELLIDTDGRVYLDMVNNVASVGHAHPRIAAAASRQLRLLNTNSRFHYRAVVEYAERIAATLPEELDTVFFVNSGSEAADLAIRLAMAATGRTDILAMREAYHGWTYASDAVSTSIADNPNALATRPPWVRTVDAANAFRGRHRGAEASRYAPEAVEVVRAMAADGHPPAGLICETFFGNAGGVPLPDGYLREVYAAVRAAGGLAIADEVQVGFGRLGTWFWGFQQQDVVPDIVAVAKSIGSGQPIGAVITRRELADRYRAGGYFFSSTGGSPVSAVIGTTVLDIIRDEGLQENARVVGAHLKARLDALAQAHPIVGAVHGAGLYLGVEFVRDRATLEPATQETAAICDRLLELGVIMQPTGDFQNVLKIKPPLCVTQDSADHFVDALERVLTTGW